MFSKAILRTSPRGGRKKRYVTKAILMSRLQQWRAGGLVSLWSDARSDERGKAQSFCSFGERKQSQSQLNTKQAITLGQEGCYGDAMRALGSYGCASIDDPIVLDELRDHHLVHDLLE